MTAAERLTLADILRLLGTGEEGPFVGYRQKALLWSLLDQQVTPKQILELLFKGDVEGIDTLIFDQEH